MADHVGVRDAATHAVARTGRQREALDGGDVVVAHEAVAIPLGAPVAQPQAVHHAVAGEPVVLRGDLVGHRSEVPDRYGLAVIVVEWPGTA